MEGKAGRRDRKRFIAHLDTCFDCLQVLEGASSYEVLTSGETTASDSALPWWLRLPFPKPLRYAVLAASLAALFVLAWHFQSGHSPKDYAGSDRLTALLYSREPEISLGNLLEGASPNTFGFAMGTSTRQAAFRAGVSLVDIRIALHEGRTDDAAVRAKAISGVPSSSSDLLASALAANASPESVLDALRVFEMELGERHDRAWVAYGSWAEVGRLASAIRCSSCLEDKRFQRVLETIQSVALEEPVRETLTEIVLALTPQASPVPDFSRLERAFGRLILLY